MTGVKRMGVFALRNLKEIVRDPVNAAFGLGFPVVLLLLFSAIQSKIPADIYAINKITPGVAVFGLSFISLFSATLLSKDRSTSFLARLFASPLTSRDFIFGYALPLLPLAALQGAVCFGFGLILGLDFGGGIFVALLAMLLVSVFFIGLGLIAGSVFNDKQVGGICGALLTNLTAWLSGTWFDLKLVGGAFEAAANLLPFAHAADAMKAAVAGDWAGLFPHLWWILGYSIVSITAAIYIFKSKMNGEKA